MIEGKIAQLEAEKAEVEKALYSAPPGAVTQVRQLYEQVESLTQAIDAATERWLELRLSLNFVVLKQDRSSRSSLLQVVRLEKIFGKWLLIRYSTELIVI